ncbi:uncharacterized protein [Henckelia pumila]|uniref:uncharacterized protein n=1 Tax=Henckelia pumila TaxID=405737 RepID=UPI003C6E6FE3
MAGHGDESHKSVGGRWGDDEEQEPPQRHHRHRDDMHRSYLRGFVQVAPKPLEGGETPKVADNWLEGMENCFEVYRCTDKQKMQDVKFLLQGSARKWWRSTSTPFISERISATWEDSIQNSERFTSLQHLDNSLRPRAQYFKKTSAYYSSGSISGSGSGGGSFHFGKKKSQCEKCGGRHPTDRCRGASVPQRPSGQTFGSTNQRQQIPCHVFALSHDQFCPVEGDSWYFYGEEERPLMSLVSSLKACQALEAGGKAEMQMRKRQWMDLLKDYDCKIRHHPGSTNPVAGALSHKKGKQGIRVFSVLVEPSLFARIREVQFSDLKKQKLARLAQGDNTSGFHFQADGFLCLSCRVVIPDDSTLRNEILSQAHCRKFSVDPGTVKMYKDLCTRFW